AELKWGTGWTMGEAKRALTALDVVEVDLGDATGLMLADAGDAGDAEPWVALPWVALLPALDPTPMGWAGREWYLGEHAKALFDRSGNVGPTVWCGGRVVG